MKTVVIIGGGLGGLFAGALLAKEGLRVTLIEKNVIVGGGLQSFKRFGEVFDTGMHVLGGMRKGGSVYRLCQYLGLSDKIRIKDVDAHCASRLYFAEDGHYYDIAEGKAGFVNSLAALFPAERENLQAYEDAIERAQTLGALESIHINFTPPQEAQETESQELLENTEAQG